MKVSAPLLSESASGSVGPFLTFSKRKSGQQVRFQTRQHYPATADQATQRAAFAKARCACDALLIGELFLGVALLGNELSLYTTSANKNQITEQNQCVSEYLLN